MGVPPMFKFLYMGKMPMPREKVQGAELAVKRKETAHEKGLMGFRGIAVRSHVGFARLCAGRIFRQWLGAEGGGREEGKGS